MIYEANNQVKQKLFSMFKSMDDTVILSCLQGHMGKAFVDNSKNPSVAQVIVGDFVAFAGDPYAKGAEELLDNIPEDSLVIGTDAWKLYLESVHPHIIEKIQRYCFKRNFNDLDPAYIRTFLSTLPKGYKLSEIDSVLVKEASLHDLSIDFTGEFKSENDFLNRGIGFAILFEGQVVCAASSYLIFDNGIEIEIATHHDHRRKGLATIAASALIITCLERGLYPNWDAATLNSVRLAEKLGYVFKKTYDAYYVGF